MNPAMSSFISLESLSIRPFISDVNRLFIVEDLHKLAWSFADDGAAITVVRVVKNHSQRAHLQLNSHDLFKFDFHLHRPEIKLPSELNFSVCH